MPRRHDKARCPGRVRIAALRNAAVPLLFPDDYKRAPTAYAGGSNGPMSFWRKLFGDVPEPKRLDYLNEGLALERQGDLEGALTSFRLAFRDNPQDVRVLLHMAMAYSKASQPEEAIRHYRRALDIDPSQGGAHYGVAFLLLRRDEPEAAMHHLKHFLQRPPKGPDGVKWVEHAQRTLERLAATASEAPAQDTA